MISDMEKKRNITLNLPRALLNDIKRLAAERETSMSKVITEALEELVKNNRELAQSQQYAIAKGDK